MKTFLNITIFRFVMPTLADYNDLENAKVEGIPVLAPDGGVYNITSIGDDNISLLGIADGKATSLTVKPEEFDKYKLMVYL
jgi:hypothetical protein